MATYSETARAKINLTLHVGKLRADGYHPLSSLVVFADIGDHLAVTPNSGGADLLQITGPFCGGLKGEDDNLVLQASRLFGALKPTHTFHLTKNLPIASGIGGGSADAAAALRLLQKTGAETPLDLQAQAAALGADIPVCLQSRTCVMEGIGERLTFLPGLGTVPAVLVNPGVGVSTGKVFRAFDLAENHSETSAKLSGDTQNAGLLERAIAGKNDLQRHAIELAPQVSDVLAALQNTDGCKLARMSGSGATCFGLYETHAEAALAAKTIKAAHPNWWCAPATLGDAE